MLLLAFNVARCDVPLGLLQRPTDTLRLYAVGDINLGRRLAKERLLEGDTLYPFLALRDSLASADITFGNLESPIAPDSNAAPDSVGIFTAPPSAAAALARAGFDVVSTANNHAWDGGPAAVEETMRQLTRAGVRFVGSGFGRDMAEQPVILELRGWRVAFFALTRAWNPAPYTFHSHAGSQYIAWGDTGRIYPAIREVKANGRADLIVVSMHGGTEYVDTPPKHMQDLARGLVDAGARVARGGEDLRRSGDGRRAWQLGSSAESQGYAPPHAGRPHRRDRAADHARGRRGVCVFRRHRRVGLSGPP